MSDDVVAGESGKLRPETDIGAFLARCKAWGASNRRLCTNPRVQSNTDRDTETPLKFDCVNFIQSG